MACVYILVSASTKKFYIGSSREDAANTRLVAHNSGKTKSTKKGRPWIRVYAQYHATYAEARKREIFLKSGVGRKWIAQEFGHYKNNGVERWLSG